MVRAALAGLIIILAIVLFQVFKGPSYPNELYIDSVAAPVASMVEKIRMDRPYYNKKIRNKTVLFYKKNHHKTKWLEYKGPNRNYSTYVDAIKDAAQYGLNPDHYDLKAIDADVKSIFDNKKRTPEEIAAMDVRVTASFFLFTTHLIEGRIRTAGYGDFIWKRNIPRENDVDLLLENSSGNLSDIIEELHPKHEQYGKLRKALAEYRKLDESVKIELTAGNVKGVIKPGTKHPSIPKIRQRLSLTDLKPYDPGDDSLRYDDKLVEAVKQFQTRHNLVADGNISQATLKYLNQTFSRKVQQIEVNLERIRWLPEKYGDDYISINVPEYMMRVYQNGKKEMEMKVVLGSEFNATPIFNDSLEYIVFSPTWNVPASILEEEFIPELQKNPRAFDPERFVITKDGKEINPEEEDWNDKDLDPTKYKMTERPNEENSLGLVKFMMPNNYNIYLHDTPAESLFRKNKRAYSHGCIRLEKPLDFAEYLLRDNSKWDEKAIRESLQLEEPKTVPLKKKYHVEIEYRTVWVDEKGLVHFREDIYGHDQRQIALLNKIE